MTGSGLWVVVPAYNEASVIATTLRDLSKFVRNVVVVDDGSRDDTNENAAAPGVHVVRHVVNQGQGAALQTGIEFALRRGADFVCTFDADGQHDPATIPIMLELLSSGEYDVALGTRFGTVVTVVPFFRRVVLAVALLVTRMQTRLPLTDTHNGLRMFTRLSVIGMHLQQRGMAHASEILTYVSTTHLRVVEVPSAVRYTAYSLAKGQKLSNSFAILLDLLYARLTK